MGPNLQITRLERPPSEDRETSGVRSELADYTLTPPSDRSGLQREARRERYTDHVLTTGAQEELVNGKRDTLKQQLQNFNELEIALSASALNGAPHNLEATREAIGKTGFFAWASGALSGMRASEHADQLNLAEKSRRHEYLVSANAQTQEFLKAGSTLLEEAKKAETQGNTLVAARIREHTSLMFDQVSHALHNAGIPAGDPSVTIRAFERSSQLLEEGVRNLNSTEKVLRTTQKAAILTGVIASTGGTGLLASGGALTTTNVLGGVALGTVTGTGLGGASAFIEAKGHVIRDNKSSEQAYSDATQETFTHARDSLVTSIGTVAGMGASRKVAGAIGESLGSGNIANASKNLLGGTAAGITESAIDSVVHLGTERMTADSRFAQLHPEGTLNAGQRGAAYAEFLKKEGLTPEHLAGRFFIEAGQGGLGGSVGGGANALRAISTSVRSHLMVEAGQAAADLVLGLGSAAITGNLTPEGIANSAANVALGSAAARVSPVHKAAMSVDLPTINSESEISNFRDAALRHLSETGRALQVRINSVYELQAARELALALPKEAVTFKAPRQILDSFKPKESENLQSQPARATRYFHQTYSNEVCDKIRTEGFVANAPGGAGNDGSLRGVFLKEDPELLLSQRIGNRQIQVEVPQSVNILDLRQELPGSFVDFRGSPTGAHDHKGSPDYALAGWLERKGHTDVAQRYQGAIDAMFNGNVERLDRVWPEVTALLKKENYSGVTFLDMHLEGAKAGQRFDATVIFNPEVINTYP